MFKIWNNTCLLDGSAAQVFGIKSNRIGITMPDAPACIACIVLCIDKTVSRLHDVQTALHMDLDTVIMLTDSLQEAVCNILIKG